MPKTAMVNYVVTDKHPYTIEALLRTWPSVAIPFLRIIGYGALPGRESLPSGAYLFTDIDRLTAEQRQVAAAVWDQLAAAGPAVRLLNHPRRTLRRTELLTRLHETGRNRFRVFRPTASLEGVRYPAFVREADEHTGPLTPLLHDEAALRRGILELVMRGHERGRLLVIEFCDTADAAGIYRKYSAFRVGDRIVPRHLLFSRDWVIKDGNLRGTRYRDDLYEYFDRNPHERELRHIFDEARCDYGRIDYSILDGQIQVWEINTNPVVVRPRHRYRGKALSFHHRFATNFAEALRALCPSETTDEIPMSFPSEPALAVGQPSGSDAWAAVGAGLPAGRLAAQAG